MNISVVTVCFNAAATIAATFESVLQQEYMDYEYLVIDGKSTDNTMDIVREYSQRFNEKGISFHMLSERDHGIYDAMNKAIKMAEGTWIYFLNADDRLYDSTVFGRVFIDKHAGADVVYGKVMKVDKDRWEVREHRDVENIVQEMPFCHQGAFTRTKTMNRYMFDTKYRICADYDFFLKLYLNGGKFAKVEEMVACFSMEGMSGTNFLKMLREGYDVRRDNGVLSLREKLYFNCYWYPANWYHLKRIKGKK